MIPVAIIMSVLSIALALNSFRLCGKVEGAEAKSKALQSDLRDMDVVRASMEGRLLDKGVEARRFKDALAEAVGQLEAEKKRADLAERNRRGAHDSTSKVAAKVAAKLEIAERHFRTLSTFNDNMNLELDFWRGVHSAAQKGLDHFEETGGWPDVAPGAPVASVAREGVAPKYDPETGAKLCGVRDCWSYAEEGNDCCWVHRDALVREMKDAPRTEVEPSVVGQVAHDRMRGETR